MAVPLVSGPGDVTEIRSVLNTLIGQYNTVIDGMQSNISTSGRMSVVEQDLGSIPRYSGYFDVATSKQTTNRTVRVTQNVGPYTGKGNLQDESEMDMVTAMGYVKDPSTIRVFWNAGVKNGPVVGNIKFALSVSL